MKIRQLAAVIAAFAAPAFAADNFAAISATPNPAKAGQPVTITVSGDTDSSIYCGMKINFGDGRDERLVVGGADGPFPKSAKYTYARPGTYTIRADGTKVDGRFGCSGKVMAKLVIEGTPPSAAPGKASGGTACPEGYKMKGKVGKAGAFTCTAGKGARKPEKIMDCGDKLEYFQTRATLGCRKPK
jgi:hypothetical protein